MNSAITGSTADYASFIRFAIVKDGRFTSSFPIDIVLKFEKIATKNPKSLSLMTELLL